MLPNNEFWQCPSYTWSSFVIGIMVSIVIVMAFMVNDGVGELMMNVGGVVVFIWAARTLYHWGYPDPRCATVGFPGQHYANPFASSV
jgi:hypothetical protein